MFPALGPPRFELAQPYLAQVIFMVHKYHLSRGYVSNLLFSFGPPMQDSYGYHVIATLITSLDIVFEQFFGHLDTMLDNTTLGSFKHARAHGERNLSGQDEKPYLYKCILTLLGDEAEQPSRWIC